MNEIIEFVNHAKIQIVIMTKKNEPVNDMNFVTGSNPIYRQGALIRERGDFLRNHERVLVRIFGHADDVAAGQLAG